MGLSTILSMLRGDELTPGQKVDDFIKRARMKSWRQSEVIRVEAAGKSFDVHVRKGSSDYSVVWQCFVDNQYDVPVVWKDSTFHKDLLQTEYERIVARDRRPLILDLGANMGASALWFRSRYPRAKIVAVEPSADNAEVLRRNIASREDMTVVQAGAGGKPGTMYLGNETGGSWGYRTTDVVNDQPITIKTVDEIISETCDTRDVPFILKIDIEGAEKSLFSGPLDTIARFPLIIVEPHDYCIPADGVTTPFFTFHADRRRDFLFGSENVFSFDIGRAR